MKAYVIKNKKGEYFRGFDIISCEPEFCEDIIDAMPYEEDDNAIPVIKDTTIVPITISEGDLEEENRVLKKALELACETIDEHYTIDIDYLYGYERMEDYFIQQAKESKDEF